MRRRLLALLAAGMLLGLTACGDGWGSGRATPAASGLSHLSWVGGDAVPLRGPSRRLRVLAFLRPDHPPSLRLARRLEALRARHPDLDVVGLSTSGDEQSVAALRQDAGISFPVCFGLDAEEKASFGLQEAPSVQIVDEAGRVVGRDLISLEARLR